MDVYDRGKVNYREVVLETPTRITYFQQLRVGDIIWYSSDEGADCRITVTGFSDRRQPIVDLRVTAPSNGVTHQEDYQGVLCGSLFTDGGVSLAADRLVEGCPLILELAPAEDGTVKHVVLPAPPFIYKATQVFEA